MVSIVNHSGDWLGVAMCLTESSNPTQNYVFNKTYALNSKLHLTYSIYGIPMLASPSILISWRIISLLITTKAIINIIV